MEKASSDFSQCVGSGFINKKYKWEGIHMDVPMKGKCVKLPHDAFEVSLDSKSIPVKDIVSYIKTLGHHSPAVNNLM